MSNFKGMPQFNVTELEWTGDTEWEAYDTMIRDDVAGLMVMVEMEGDGECRVGLNGDPFTGPENTTYISPTDEQNRTIYLTMDPTHGIGEARLDINPLGITGRLKVTIVRLLRRLGGFMSCALCKKAMRSVLALIFAALGIPNLPLFDDTLTDAFRDALNRSGTYIWDKLPDAVADFIRQISDALGQDFISILNDFFDWVRQVMSIGGIISGELCRRLGLCT